MKPDRLARRVSADLVLLRFPAAPVVPPCPHCSAPLTLHQPDTGWPERLLLACEGCRHWYLLDLLPDRAEEVLVALPDPPTIRELALEAAPGGRAEDAPEGGPGGETPGG